MSNAPDPVTLQPLDHREREAWERAAARDGYAVETWARLVLGRAAHVAGRTRRGG